MSTQHLLMYLHLIHTYLIGTVKFLEFCSNTGFAHMYVRMYHNTILKYIYEKLHRLLFPTGARGTSNVFSCVKILHT